MLNFIKTEPILTVFVAAFCIFAFFWMQETFENDKLDKKIKILEAEKQKAVTNAQNSMNAANETRAVNNLLKTQLTELSQKAKKLDDEIEKQTSIVSDNRNRVNAVRAALPVQRASAELNAELCELYPDDCKR